MILDEIKLKILVIFVNPKIILIESTSLNLNFKLNHTFSRSDVLKTLHITYLINDYILLSDLGCMKHFSFEKTCLELCILWIHVENKLETLPINGIIFFVWILKVMTDTFTRRIKKPFDSLLVSSNNDCAFYFK